MNTNERLIRAIVPCRVLPKGIKIDAVYEGNIAMPDDTMTESQGKTIIRLLEKILAESEKINADLRFEIKSVADAANYNLILITKAIEKIGETK